MKSPAPTGAGEAASPVIAGVLALAPAQRPQRFTGVITDDMCARGDHSGMRMGPNDAECTRACVAIHGAAYVLYNGKDVYMLSGQQTPEKFAGEWREGIGHGVRRAGRTCLKLSVYARRLRQMPVLSAPD
jgi:hypothetical protein